MTLTIELPPDREAVLKEEAESRGLSVEQWLVEIVAQHVRPAESSAHLHRTDPMEWERRFDAWLKSHDPGTPVLSDEAMSRDSIYPDRT
jgi:hypothetical protein